MIKEVLTVLKNTLNDSGGFDDSAVVEDIAKHDDGTPRLDNKVIISLLNVEEESTLKNRSWYTRTTVNQNPPVYNMKKQSPPAYLNLYVIIAANMTFYESGLMNISKVIEVFQTNNVLEYNDLKFRVELHSIPFEQLSYVWGLLGGKVMPSVLYKVSVVKIAATDEAEIKLIDEVNITSLKVD